MTIQKNLARDWEIWATYRATKTTYERLAGEYGVTRARIQQIVNAHRRILAACLPRLRTEA